MSLRSKTIKEDRFELKIEDSIIKLEGDIDCAQPKKYLQPFFMEVNSEVIKTGLKEVTVDITQLRLLNSSGIKELIDWVLRIQELPEDKQYSIFFLYNPFYTWQDSSFSSIKMLSPQLVNISPQS